MERNRLAANNATANHRGPIQPQMSASDIVAKTTTIMDESTFASDLMELAFAFDSNPQSTTFSAYLNGALVDSSSFNTVMLSDAPAQGGAGAPR